MARFSGGVGGGSGEAGPPGPAGADGQDALWNFIGEYDNGLSYAPGDVVTYNGGTYYRVGEPNPGYAPGTSYWTTVATPGSAGAAGVDGASAYEVAVANGFVGTEQQWLDSLVGTGGGSGSTGITDPSDFSEVSVILPMEDVTAKKTSPYFVYVSGSGSTLYTSTNGTEFDSVTVGGSMGMGFSSQVGKVFRKTNGDIFAYPEYYFYNVLKSSDNGASWTGVPWSVEENEFIFAWYYYYAQANSGDTLVSMNQSKLYYSTNGLDFIKGTFPFSNPSGNTWNGQSSIVWDGNRFIASFIPSPTDLPTDKVFISTSINGISWGTPVELNLSGVIDTSNGISSQRATLYSIGSRYFIVVAGQTAYSDNLTSWTAINTPETNPNFNDSSYNFIVGEKAFVLYSKNYSTSIVTVSIYSPELGYDEFTQISSLPSNLSSYLPSDSVPFYVSEAFNGFYVRDYNNSYASAYKLNSDGSWTETLTPFGDEKVSFYEDIDITNVRFDGVIENGFVQDTTDFEVPGNVYMYSQSSPFSAIPTTSYDKASYNLEDISSIIVSGESSVYPIGTVNGRLFAAAGSYNSSLERYVSKIHSSTDGINFDLVYEIDVAANIYPNTISDITYFDGNYIFVVVDPSAPVFKIFYSSDLASWSSIDLLETTNNNAGYNGLVATDGNILLVSSLSGRYVVKLASLTDTPTVVADYDSNNVRGMSYDSSAQEFILTGQTTNEDLGYANRSVDGETWTIIDELNSNVTYTNLSGSSSSAYASDIRNIWSVQGKYIVDYGSMGGLLIFDENFTSPRSFQKYLIENSEDLDLGNGMSIGNWGLNSSSITVIDGLAYGTVSRYNMNPGSGGGEVKAFKTNLSNFIDVNNTSSNKIVRAFSVSKTRQNLSVYVSDYIATSVPGIASEIVADALTSVSITGGTLSGVEISNSTFEGLEVGYPVDGSVNLEYVPSTNRYNLTARTIVDGKTTVLFVLPEGFSYMGMGGIRIVNGKPVYSGSFGPGPSIAYYGTAPLTLPSVNSMTYFDNLYYANGKYFITMRQCGTTCVYSLFVSDDLSTWTELSEVFIDQSGDRYIQTIRDIVYIHGEYSILYNSYDQVTSTIKIHESYSSNLTSWSQQEITAPSENFTSINLESFTASPNKMNAVGAIYLEDSVAGTSYIGIMTRPSAGARWQVVDSEIAFGGDASMDNSVRVAISNNGRIVISGYTNQNNANIFKYSDDNGATWTDVDTQSLNLDISQGNNLRLHSNTKKLVFRISLAAGAITEYYSSNDGKTWEYYATSSSYGGSLSWVSLPMSITDAFLNAEWGL